MAISARLVFVLSVILPLATTQRAFAQVPDVESCSTIAASFDSDQTLEVEIFDSIVIGDTQVFVDISALIVGYFSQGPFTITSPLGTTVELHNGAGAFTSDFNVTFYDDGDPYGEPRYSPGTTPTASEFDCAGCLMQPSGPGALADFNGEYSDGTWTLTWNLSFSYIHEFCLSHFLEEPTRRVRDLVCTAMADGTGEISWTHGGDYDQIAIYVNDVLQTWLLGPFAKGDSFTFATEALAVPQLVEVCIIPTTAGMQPAPETRCHIALTAAPTAESTIEPMADFVFGSPFEGTLTFPGTAVITDLQVEVQIRHDYIGAMRVDLTSPSGTSVVLHFYDGGDSDGLDVLYWDGGLPRGAASFDGHFPMQPASQDGLAAFAGESIGGDWTIEVQTQAFTSGIVARVSIRAYDETPVLGVKDLACTADQVADSITVTWTNGADYDEIQIRLNGVLEATLAGPFLPNTAETYTTLPILTPGDAEVRVTGKRGEIAAPAHCCSDFIMAGAGIEACGTLNVFTGPNGSSFGSSGTLDISEVLWISEVEVSFRTGSLPYGDSEYTIVSPSGTSVQVLEIPDNSGNLPRLEVVIDEDGIEFGADSFDCACHMQPSGPGTLEDLTYETSGGDWILQIYPSGFEAFEEWCIRIYGCAAPPPANFNCDPSGLEVLLTWTNEDVYDEIEIVRNDAVVAGLPGITTSYSDVALAPGRYVYRIIGHSSALACSSKSQRCLTGVGYTEVCEEDVEMMGAFPDDVLGIDFADSITVGTVEVVFDAEIVSSPPTDLYLGSPYGTELRLHDNLGSGDVFALIWSDSGEPLRDSTVSFDCGFCTIKPFGPGSLGDFAGEISAGQWTLTASPWAPNAEIDHWCVAIYEGCALQAPGDLSCDASENVALNWTANLTYASLEITRDGAVLASLDAAETTYTDIAPARGYHEYELRAFGLDSECYSRSRGCLVCVGGTSTCETGTLFQVFGVNASIGSVLVAEPMVIGEVEVLLEVTLPFNSGWDLSIESPFATEVQIHDRADGGGPFAVVWSDTGAPYAPGSVTLNCDFCLVQPSGPGAMADFFGEIADGVWSLRRSGSGSLGQITRWCLALYPGCEVLPPGNTSCEPDAEAVLIAWSNSDTYTSIEIERDGVLIATMSADTTSYADAHLLGGPYSYRVFGVSSTLECRSGSLHCALEHRLYEQCEAPLLSIPPDTTTGVEMDFGDDIQVQEIEVRVELSGLSLSSYDELAITSPEGTRVVLFNGTTNSAGEFDMTFSQLGAMPAFGLNYDCSCKIRPDLPGDLREFEGEAAGGDWLFEIAIGDSNSAATLNEWCLRIFEGCVLLPPEGLLCVAADETALLEWTNGDSYDSIAVMRSGQLVSVLDGDSTSFLEEGLTAGVYEYRVIGESTLHECGSRSKECRSVVGDSVDCSAASNFVTGDPSKIHSSLLWFSGGSATQIDQVEVYVDISTGNDGDWQQISVESPEGTRVQLHSAGGSGTAGFRLTYSDSGDANDGTSDQYLCGCLVQPSGPGQMSDFEGEDANGVWSLELETSAEGILNEWCVVVSPAVPEVPLRRFLRGDVDSDGVMWGIVDTLYLLNWSFNDGEEPLCMDAADVDGDNVAPTVADAVLLLTWFFANGPAPPAPGPFLCGFDPDADLALDCELSAYCPE